MTSFDVAVIGLGAMGSATARFLAAKGLSVIGFDKFRPPHEFGSTHGESRIIRQAYFENSAYVPLALNAYDEWHALEQETGEKLLNICGGLFLGGRSSEVFEGSLSAARQHQLPYEVLDSDEIRKRYPVMHPSGELYGLFEERAGMLAVEPCVAAMLRSAERQGAQLHYHEPVLSWESKGADYQLQTAKATYCAKYLVITPGAWAPALCQLEIPLVVERLIMHWFAPECDVGVFLPHRYPVHIWEVGEGTSFYGMPAMNDGKQGVKIAFHNIKQPCDPDQVERKVGFMEVEQMRHYLASYIPDLNGKHLRSAVCLYTSSPDSDFVVGAHPEYERVFIGCGFSGHGFKFAPVIGRALGQLICDGCTSEPIGHFDPKRLS